jgi:putative transposase
MCPGTTFSNPWENPDYDSKRHACLTLEELRPKLSQWIYDVYHETAHEGLGMPPRLAWDRALATQPPPQRYSDADLDALCRSITHSCVLNGRVRFANLSWTGPALSSIAFRLKKKQKALVYYDSADLSIVWVAHPDSPAELYEAYATMPNYQNGLTLFEHNLVQAQTKKQNLAFSECHARRALLDIHEKIRELYESKKPPSSRKKTRDSKKAKTSPPPAQDNNFTAPPMTWIPSDEYESGAFEVTSKPAKACPYPIISLPGKGHE